MQVHDVAETQAARDEPLTTENAWDINQVALSHDWCHILPPHFTLVSNGYPKSKKASLSMKHETAMGCLVRDHEHQQILFLHCGPFCSDRDWTLAHESVFNLAPDLRHNKGFLLKETSKGYVAGDNQKAACEMWLRPFGNLFLANLPKPNDVVRWPCFKDFDWPVIPDELICLRPHHAIVGQHTDPSLAMEDPTDKSLCGPIVCLTKLAVRLYNDLRLYPGIGMHLIKVTAPEIQPMLAAIAKVITHGETYLVREIKWKTAILNQFNQSLYPRDLKINQRLYDQIIMHCHVRCSWAFIVVIRGTITIMIPGLWNDAKDYPEGTVLWLPAHVWYQLDNYPWASWSDDIGIPMTLTLTI